jgi:hypothetical protein
MGNLEMLENNLRSRNGGPIIRKGTPEWWNIVIKIRPPKLPKPKPKPPGKQG